MSLELFLFLFALAGIAGFGAGFIGLGGGILLFPLLIYLPQLLGLDSIDAKTAAALVSSQVFFSGLIGSAAHLRKGRVHKKLTIVGATASAFAAFTGGILSKWVSEGFLLLLFGIVTVIAGLVTFLPAPTAEREETAVDSLAVGILPLGVISLGVGSVVGLLGAGNFLFVPLLIYVLKIPTRVTIGSSLAIYMMNSLFGFFGKLITGQIPFLMTLGIVIGASLSAWVGEKCHSSVSPQFLRHTYSVVIAVVALRIWLTLLAW